MNFTDLFNLLEWFEYSKSTRRLLAAGYAFPQADRNGLATLRTLGVHAHCACIAFACALPGPGAAFVRKHGLSHRTGLLGVLVRVPRSYAYFRSNARNPAASTIITLLVHPSITTLL